MKKFALIISLVIACASTFSVCACATSVTAGTESLLETKEIYAAIPEGYEFSPYTEEDKYFTYMDEEYNLLYIDIQANDSVDEGITKLSDKEIKDLFKINFVLEGEEEYYDYYEVNYSNVKIVDVNGVKAYNLVGDYAWVEEGMPEDEIDRSGFSCYVTATEENIYFIAITDDEEVFDEDEAINSLISSASINGTYFGADKTTASTNFVPYDTYENVLAASIKEYWASYDEEYYDEEYYDDAVYDEDLGAIIIGVCAVIICVTVIPTTIIIIVAIVLIVKYSKKKKQLNELEKKFGAGYIQQPYTAQTVAQPYGAQPAPQAVPQSVAQPVPQPVNAEAEAKTVINGEIQDNNQQ